MRRHSARFVFGIVGSIIVGFGVVAAVWIGLRSIGGLGYEPNVLRAQKTGANSAELDLSTFPDSLVCHPDAGQPEIGWVTYCPSTTFELPANSLITVVIKNYDTATPLINDFFRQVQGTVGGTETVSGTTSGNISGSVSQVDAQDVSHTFTIQSTPDNVNSLYVSVPVVGVPDDAKPDAVTVAGNPYPEPVTISFQFRTGAAGSNYVWHCYDPCGSDREAPYGFSGPMATTGYMSGTISVASY